MTPTVAFLRLRKLQDDWSWWRYQRRAANCSIHVCKILPCLHRLLSLTVFGLQMVAKSRNCEIGRESEDEETPPSPVETLNRRDSHLAVTRRIENVDHRSSFSVPHCSTEKRYIFRQKTYEYTKTILAIAGSDRDGRQIAHGDLSRHPGGNISSTNPHWSTLGGLGLDCYRNLATGKDRCFRRRRAGIHRWRVGVICRGKSCRGKCRGNNFRNEKGQPYGWPNSLILLVGARGFEPPTPCTPCTYATRLRYAPTSQ